MKYVHSLLVTAALSLLGLLLPSTGWAADCTSNLLIVLDRSCSMTSNSIMGKTRWDIAVDAIKKLTTENAGKLRFGLAMFPNKNAASPKCVQPTALLPPGANQEQMVTDLLAANKPGSPCITNIDEGIKQASTESSLFQPDRRSFVVLITDGEQSNNCNGGTATADPLTVQYITQMYDKKVPTYVVGFDVGADAQAQSSLNSFAKAGGLPNKTGTNSFYPANNQAELEATLSQLASLTSGGEFTFCKGMPCPDGRCLSATATCTSGYCVEAPADMSGGGGTDDLGDGDPSGSLATGCSCNVGGQTAASSAGAAALLYGSAVMLLRRRRRSSPSAG